METLSDISHIKLRASKERTIFDESIVVLLTTAVNLPTNLTKPSGGVVRHQPVILEPCGKYNN